MILVYRTPWWRDFVHIGRIHSAIDGPITTSWKISTPENSIYTLAIFTATNDWDTLFNSSLCTLQRQAAVLDDLARIVGEMFGEEKTVLVYDVMEYRDQDWYRMAYIEGAPIVAMGPGEFGKLAPALREVVGHVHFGGAEMAG